MKKVILPLFLIGLALASCNKKGGTFGSGGTVTDSLSYALGFTIGQDIRTKMAGAGMTEDIDLKEFMRAFAVALDSMPGALNEMQMKEVVTRKSLEMRAKQISERSKQFEAQQAQGQAFLAENAKRPGVVTTASGLQYEIVQAGKGPKPTANDKVKVAYRGTLMDGTEFDNSANHGGSVEFMAGEVIPGWTEALQLMPVGSKWKIWLPYEIAYGERGAGEDIPPYATLLFDIELIDIVKK